MPIMPTEKVVSQLVVFEGVVNCRRYHLCQLCQHLDSEAIFLYR